MTESLEPVEIEMGDTKFIVVDDRDGHIPLVRNKKVDQFISYFQNRYYVNVNYFKVILIQEIIR